MHRLIFIFIALLSHSLSAATLNVPSQYGTVQGALDAAQPGDTIIIAPGNYNELVITKTAGTSDNPIVIDGGAAANVTLRAVDVRHAYTTWRNLTVRNTVQSSTGKCVFINRGAHYTRLERLTVDAAYTQYMSGIEFASGSTRPFSTDAPSNCVVTECTVTRVQSATMIDISGNANVIEDNILQDGDRVDFFRLWGIGNIIRRNRADNIFLGPNSGGYHPDCYQTFGVNGYGSIDHIIEGNIFSNAQAQIAQLTDSLAGNIGNWTVRNNLFMNITNAHSCSIPDMKYYNNVFYRCNYGIGGPALGFGSRTYTANQSYTGVAGTSSAHGAQAFNNIFIDCGDKRNTTGWYSFDLELQGVAADYNAVIKYGAPVRANTLAQPVGDPGGWNKSRFYEPNGLNGVDPQFVNIGGGDARLSTTSLMRDAGITLAGNLIDAFGTARPQGAGYDIGLYEGAGVTPVGSAPVVTIISPADNSSFVEGVPQNFVCTVVDAEDGTITQGITWGDAIQGVLGTGTSITVSLVNSRTQTVGGVTSPHPGPQQHSIYAFATDSDGRVGFATHFVDVERSTDTNTAPSLTITEPANGFSARTAEWITFTATATDAIDGDISEQIIWTSSLNGVFAEGASTETDELSVGAHTITASVTDSGGLTDSASISILISQDDVIFGSLVPLAWDANAGGENVTAYRVYERVGADPYAYIFLGQTSDLAIDVRVPGGTHYFVVTAVNAVGESPFSAALEVTNVAGSRRGRGPGKTKQLIP